MRAIVIHYTTEDDARSMQLLSKGKVSAHLLSPRVAPTAWSTKRARLARRQQLLVWHHRHETASIGIELVNPGWTQGADGAASGTLGDRQIRALTICCAT